MNLDIFWLKDERLEDSANLPPPDVIAEEIVEDLEAALAHFATIYEDLKSSHLLPEVNHRTLQLDLKKLVDQGLLAEKSSAATDPTRRYLAGLRFHRKAL